MARFKKHLQTFLPYLEELRQRLYRTLIVFVLVFLVGFLSSGTVIKFLVSHFDIANVLIATTSPFQFADVAMDIGFFTALIITVPIVVYQLFSFVSSALTPRERFRFLLTVPISVVLFCVGFVYGFLILYYSFGLLAALNYRLGIENIWDISSFLSQIFVTASLLGVVFQFPLILTLGARIGFFDITFLKQKRRLAYFLVLVLVSLLPPTDGLSLIAMALPLVLLYEATILLNRNTHHHVWTRN